jgi:HicA toxin of bacterial toxin-antitoxin,
LKVPRDVSGHELCRALARFGYTMTRQTGSHLRLTSRIEKFSEYGKIDPEFERILFGYDFVVLVTDPKASHDVDSAEH